MLAQEYLDSVPVIASVLQFYDQLLSSSQSVLASHTYLKTPTC